MWGCVVFFLAAGFFIVLTYSLLLQCSKNRKIVQLYQCVFEIFPSLAPDCRPLLDCSIWKKKLKSVYFRLLRQGSRHSVQLPHIALFSDYRVLRIEMVVIYIHSRLFVPILTTHIVAEKNNWVYWLAIQKLLHVH